MSDYSVHLVTRREELDGVIDVCWLAWWDPYIPNIRIGMPILGYAPEDRIKAIAESKERLWAEYEKKKPWENSRYIYARHDASGEIVGGLRIDFFEGSPWPNGEPKLSLPWWPEGESREFCERMMQHAFTPRSMWMQRPHGYMINFIVHPKHRGRGVGTLLLEYNSRELDERGIEGFVEATEMGRPAYLKAGYISVMKIASYIPDDKLDNLDWKRYYHDMGMIPFYAMWRPKNGVLRPGERNRPWQ